MAVKTTFIFELTTITKSNTLAPARETGWTESFVSQALNVADPILIQAANAYANARMPLLAAQGKIVGYRFHDLTNNATRAYPLTNPWTGTGGDCTMPQVALLTRLFANNTINNRPLELRGLPASMCQLGEYVPGSISPQIANSFFNVITFRYGMFGVDKSQPHWKVKDINAGGNVLLAESQNSIAAGDTVQFYRTTFDDTCCGSVGQWHTTAAGFRVLTLEGWDPTKTAHGGKVAKWTKPTYMPFDQSTATGGSPNGWGIERTVIRKSGRPSDLFSGRRSATCCSC